MSDSDDIKTLIEKYDRHLQKLKEQKAAFGLHTPPHVLTEIEDIEKNLEKLYTKLRNRDELVEISADELSNETISQQSKPSIQSNNPLSLKNVLAVVIITIIGGFILASIIRSGATSLVSEQNTLTVTPARLPSTPLPIPINTPWEDSFIQLTYSDPKPSTPLKSGSDIEFVYGIKYFIPEFDWESSGYEPHIQLQRIIDDDSGLSIYTLKDILPEIGKTIRDEISGRLIVPGDRESWQLRLHIFFKNTQTERGFIAGDHIIYFEYPILYEPIEITFTPEPSALVTGNFMPLIGKDLNSGEIQLLLDQMGSLPIISKSDNQISYLYRKDGLQLRFIDDELTEIELYFKNLTDNGIEEYQAVLPYDVSFNDSMEELEEKLGPPAISGVGTGGGLKKWDFPDYSILIFWGELGREGTSEQILSIRITKAPN